MNLNWKDDGFLCFLLLGLLSIGGIIQSCEDPFEELIFAEAFTESAQRIGIDSVIVNIRIDGIGEKSFSRDQSISYGVAWSETNTLPTINDETTNAPQEELADNVFSILLPNLSVTTDYYYRAYIQIDDRINYGEVRNFNLSKEDLTIQVGNNSFENDRITISAILGFTFGPIEDHGFVYATQQTFPGLIDSTLVYSLGQRSIVGEYTSIITVPEFNTDYYVWPYAVLNGEVILGERQKYEIKGGWRIYAQDENFELIDPKAVVIGDQALIGFGCLGECSDADANATNNYLEFDPATDFGKSSLERLRIPTARRPRGRREGAFFQSGDTLYYGLGSVNSVYQNDFWVFDLASLTWSLINTVEDDLLRENAIGFKVKESVYLGSGANVNRPNSDFLNDYQKFNLTTGMWSILPDADLPLFRNGNVFNNSGRNNTALIEVDGRIFAGFGTLNDDLWEFDKTNETWEYAGTYSIPTSSSIHSMVIGGRVFLGLDREASFRLTRVLSTPASNRTWFEFIPPDPGMTNGQLIEVQTFPDYGDPFNVMNATFSIGDAGYLIATDNDDVSTDIWQYVPNQN